MKENSILISRMDEDLLSLIAEGYSTVHSADGNAFQARIGSKFSASLAYSPIQYSSL